MATLTDKALMWIRKFGEQKDRIRETGLPQSRLSKMFKEDGTERRISIDEIETIARTRRVRPSDVIRDIESVGTELEATPQRETLSVDDQSFILWQELFAQDGLRARRVLKNLQQQEALGYTDLVSQVVRLIIEMGPQASDLEVAQLLRGFEEKQTKKLERTRKQFKKEYSRIK